jgi:hypothetical protein
MLVKTKYTPVHKKKNFNKFLCSYLQIKGINRPRKYKTKYIQKWKSSRIYMLTNVDDMDYWTVRERARQGWAPIILILPGMKLFLLFNQRTNTTHYFQESTPIVLPNS